MDQAMMKNMKLWNLMLILPQQREARERGKELLLKKIPVTRGPVPSKKMTARQRAMVAREAGEDVAEEMFSDLPDERASKRKIFTEEEMALRKSETARRRKHQAHARAEEAKHATIQKLLTKQVNKKKTKDEDTSPMKEDVDPTQIRYIQTSQMSTLSFPQHLLDSEPFLLAPAGGNAEYPLQKLCSIPGCSKPKKYRHISAEMDVCGMNHFRVAGLGVNNEL
ncbi:hypothetical protein DFJ77DRAFT_111458 [Powellomyces hirtus]|nr:hypothetical protein DFJ77DRAFT_111458 [Powellomyces hirtus]